MPFCRGQSIAQRTTTLILMFALVVTPALIGFARPANAQMAVIDKANLAVNTKSAVTNTLQAKSLLTLELKEYVLDGILYAIVKKLAQQIVKSTLRWVASGFQGSPMFVTNPQQFLLSTADQVAGEFIYGSSLGALCSPMSVRSALNTQYLRSTGRLGNAAQCTLSGALGNARGLLGGASGMGNWSGWASVLSNPANAPLTSALSAQGQLENRIASEQATEKMKWDWGKGFLPKENCTTVSGEKTCKTTTPGETIAQAVNFDLSIGKRELIAADEINEIISALLSQLANQALSAAGGLFSLGQAGSGSGYSGGGGGTGTGATTNTNATYCSQLSYLDQMGDPRCDGMSDGSTGAGSTTSSLSPLISNAVQAETSYQNMNQQITSAAGDAIIAVQDAGLTCRNNERIYNELTSIRATANSNIASSNARTQELLSLVESTSTEGALAAYATLASGNTLNTAITNIEMEETRNTTLSRITTLERTIRTCGGSDNSNDTTTSGEGM